VPQQDGAFIIIALSRTAFLGGIQQLLAGLLCCLASIVLENVLAGTQQQAGPWHMTMPLSTTTDVRVYINYLDFVFTTAALCCCLARVQIDKNKLLVDELSAYLPDRRSELSAAVVRVRAQG
jgi:hypothetical protein